MRHDEREWSEGLAAALVVAGLAAVIYLARVCLTVGVRTVVKYPHQPVVLGIVASWVLALIVALAVATMPEGGVLAVWVALGATTLAVDTGCAGRTTDDPDAVRAVGALLWPGLM